MGRTLRILSANLWNGRAAPEAFVDLVLALAVDVVAVQEISPEQAEALSAVMPHGELEPGLDHEGMGIVMQRPGKMSRLELRGRGARITRLSPEGWPQLGAPLEVMNVHIMAPQLLRPEPALITRRYQIESLESYFASAQTDQRVVVGDFNATPGWPLYRRMASQFTDAAVTVAERVDATPAPTWGPWHGSPRMLRIDHGFVSGPVVEDFRVVEIPGGDHSAIVMDVSCGSASQAPRG